LQLLHLLNQEIFSAVSINTSRHEHLQEICSLEETEETEETEGQEKAKRESPYLELENSRFSFYSTTLLDRGG
jgi:hypothetical protein